MTHKGLGRLEALQIAAKYDIEVWSSWWNPFAVSGVGWKVLRSRKKLSDDQYYYLSNRRNDYLKVKRREDCALITFPNS